MTDEIPTLRRASRVVLLDESDRVLLVRFEYGGRKWWATPGGGLEGEETHEDAARREIEEETGLRLEILGPRVWNREHVFRFEGRLYRQREHYFVAVVPAFAPQPGALGAAESIAFRDLRWWTMEDLEAGTEEFAPAELPALVRRLVEHGPPERPIEVGI
ncbi:NUDIX hydrolase [Rubrobacter tropicus]|uniref:NUDIX hydrolase n=1 Tax=Rubrobacter tropicus TaxID=2653851 RepID=UPI00140AE9E8|nr:NUDIX domain-containing protein [Rubrobacter tropicus]